MTNHVRVEIIKVTETRDQLVVEANITTTSGTEVKRYMLPLHSNNEDIKQHIQNHLKVESEQIVGKSFEVDV